MADDITNILKLAGYAVPERGTGEDVSGILKLAGYATPAERSPFVSGFPQEWKPLSKIAPHELQLQDFNRLRTSDEPMTLSQLRGERETYETRAEREYEAGMKDVARSIVTTGGPKFRAKESPLEGMYAAGRPRELTDSDIAAKEELAMRQARIAVYQYEQAAGQPLSDEDRAAQLSYYREQNGLGGPVQYAHRRMWQRADADRPEDLSAPAEAAGALARSPYEILRGAGQVAGVVGGLAEGLGAGDFAQSAYRVAEGSKLWTDPFLTNPGVQASKKAAMTWNPSSLNWWVNVGVGQAPRAVIGLSGIGGAAAVGAMDAGEVWGTIVDQGGDPQQAAQIAASYGAVSAVLERVGAKVLLSDQQFTSKFSRAVWMTVYGSATEGTQEGTAILAEYLGTDKMPEDAWQRMCRAGVQAALTSAVTSYTRSLDYKGTGVQPKMPSDVIDVPTPSGKAMKVTTPKAADLPESIQSDPKAMRMQIHRMLTQTMGSKQAAVETQRQLAWQMFGRAKADNAQIAAEMQRPLSPEAEVRAKVEELGGEYKGVQVDENENPAWHVFTAPNSATPNTSLMVRDASQIESAIAGKPLLGETDTKTPDEHSFRLRDINDPDQLAEIYDAAREYKPINVPLVADAPAMNASISTTAKRLNTDGKLEVDEWNSLLQDLGLATKRGVVKEKMSRSEAYRLRRALVGHEVVADDARLLRGAREQYKAFDEVIGSYERVAEGKRSVRRAKDKLGFSRARETQSMRHWVAQVEAVTGQPLRSIYDRLLKQYHAAEYGKAAWMADIVSSDRKAVRILRRSGEDAEKIRNAIETGKFDKLTESERNVATKIAQKFKESEVEAKVRELYEYMLGQTELPNVPKEVLEYAQQEFDARGYMALYDVAKRKEFGVRENYYPKNRNREKMTLAQELAEYYTKVQGANTINPELNAFNTLIERATKLEVPLQQSGTGDILGSHTKVRTDAEPLKSPNLSDPQSIVKAAAVFNKAMRGADPSPGIVGEWINKIVGRGLTTHYARQIASIRNFPFQEIAMDNNLTLKNIPALLKHLKPEDAEWDRSQNRQDAGMLDNMLLTESKIPGIREVDRAAKVTAGSMTWGDKVSRNWSAKLSMAQTRRAIDEVGPDWKNSAEGIRKVIQKSGISARFDDVTIRRAVEELATGGDTAFVHYIAGQQSLDINGAYHLPERSIAEMQLGKVGRRLGSFTRTYAEDIGRAAHTLFARSSTPAARDQAAVVLAQLMLGSYAANNTLNKLLGYEADSYSPWNVLQFVPGGIAADWISRLWATCATVGQAIAEGEIEPLALEGQKLAEQFVPFVKTIRTTWEALSPEPVKVGRGDEVKLTKPWNKLQHALTGNRARAIVRQQREAEKLEPEEQEERERRYFTD